MTAIPISVVIPCGDHGNQLFLALNSVLTQSQKPMEIILVHNSDKALSSDLKDLVSKNGLHLIEFSELIGPSRARNVGISRSTGEYVALLDADDEWFPEKIALQYEFMKRHDLDLSTTDFAIYDFKKNCKQSLRNGSYTKYDLKRRCHLGVGSTVMFRRELYKHGLSFDENLSRFEDWDFMLRCTDSNIRYGNLESSLTLVHRLPTKSWGLASNALFAFKEKYIIGKLWDRHLASGIYLERAVIQFRERNLIFIVSALISLIKDFRQGTFYFRNFKNHILRTFCNKQKM